MGTLRILRNELETASRPDAVVTGYTGNHVEDWKRKTGAYQAQMHEIMRLASLIHAAAKTSNEEAGALLKQLSEIQHSIEQADYDSRNRLHHINEAVRVTRDAHSKSFDLMTKNARDLTPNIKALAADMERISE